MRPTPTFMALLACLTTLALVATLAPGATAFHGATTVQAGCSYVAITQAGNTEDYVFGLDSHVSTSGASDCVNGDPVDFEPGTHVTLEFGTNPTPLVNDPDTLTLEVRFDHQQTTVIRQLHQGAVPADGSTFTFWLTHDGTSLGTPAAGTLRAYIRAQHNNVVDALDYNCSSDGIFVTGASVSCTAEIGYFRSSMNVTSIAAPAPPSGTIYAYGTGADEQVTITATRDRAYVLESANDLRIDTITTVGAQVEAGTEQDHDTTATTVESFTIDNTYATTSTTYGARLVIPDNSGLTGLPYTIFNSAGLGSGVEFVSDTEVRDLDVFQANSRVRFDRDGTGPADDDATTDFSIYNRAETVTYSFRLLNARDEQLTRSMTIRVLDDPTDTVIDSQSKTGALYSGSFTIAATDPAAQSRSGTNYYFQATNTDQSADSLATFAISSLYLSDAHAQLDSTLDKDDFPTENLTENFLFISGDETMRVWCHIKNIRADTDISTTGTPVNIIIKDSEGNTVTNVFQNTGGDGWTSRTDQPAIPPTGTWTIQCTGSFDGNSWNIVQFVDVSSPFTGDKLARIFIWPNYPDNGMTRVWASIELADNPVEPDEPPELQVRSVQTNGFTAIEDVAIFQMTNVINFTQTVNGSLYFGDVELDAGNYSIRVKSFIRGTSIRNQEPYEVQSMIEIGTHDASALLELAIWAGLFLLGISQGWIVAWLIGLVGINTVILGGSNAFSFNALVAIGAMLLSLQYLLTRWPELYSNFRRQRT